MNTQGEKAAAPLPHAEAASFDEFYRAEYEQLARLGYVLTGSRPVAEELVQETMVRVLRHWKRVAGYDRPDLWARRVLVNLATSRGRRLVREGRAMLRVRNERPAEVAAARDDELIVAIRKLSAAQAQVIALHYLEDRSVADIAALLGKPENTIKTHLRRARQRLARQLGTEDAE